MDTQNQENSKILEDEKIKAQEQKSAEKEELSSIEVSDKSFDKTRSTFL